MKKYLLLFHLSLFTFLLSPAQWVSIPDTNFGTWLNTNGYAACMLGNNTLGWQMDTTCPAVVGATSINCRFGNIYSLTGIEYFDGLQILICADNQLSFLPSLPDSLTILWCSNNQLINLPALPARLDQLDCINNFLSNLPALPGALTKLSCASNQLDSLPGLPAGLNELYCGTNQLHGLPALPAGLTMLDCSNNQITTLDVLPLTLNRLWCYLNLIVSLPVLPVGLYDLDCSSNALTVLPDLPAGLTWLHCHNNLLTDLPELPDSLFSLIIQYNPLSCLPRLKRIVNLDFRYINITCIPGYGNVTNSNPPLNSLPLCDVFNLNGCEVLWNLSGKVYLDENGNCQQDSAESGIINVPLHLFRGGALVQQTPSLTTGIYSFDTDTFDIYTISIDTSDLPFIVTCPASNLNTAALTALDSLAYENDFAMECKPGFDLAAWSIWGIFRIGRTWPVEIHVGGSSAFFGVNCSGGISGNVRVAINGPASYVTPAPGALVPDNVIGNVLTYNVPDFGNTDFNHSFNIMVHTDSTAHLGDTVCITVTVSPATGDDVPANNIQTNCFVVRGAYDPNTKEVYPPNAIDVNGGLWLTYTINFQNTGTDTAQHIYVDDTLDTDLDYSTFQLLAYSHQPMVRLKENIVRFNFPNINLPDSNTSEPHSHGYVQYKIKIKNGRPLGTQINNTAYIYFDFNAPVETNTTLNTVSNITGVPRSEQEEAREPLIIFPNPAGKSVTFSVNDNLSGGTVFITDLTGRRLAAVKLETTKLKLETASFANGVYFVSVTENNGSSVTKKLIVQN